MTLRNSIFDRLDNSPSPVPHPKSWPSPDRRPPSIAYDATCAELQAKAARTARAAIKARARAYALRPRELDAIVVGLSGLSPRHLVLCLKTPNPSWRYFGFGGEVPAINLRAEMLYARYARAIASRNARRTG